MSAIRKYLKTRSIQVDDGDQHGKDHPEGHEVIAARSPQRIRVENGNSSIPHCQ